ncbi:MAG: TonB-dependent receptor [Myxococcaceae bacterium]|nr:TonB-dependent receptor [Myxococcaceae bacterium]
MTIIRGLALGACLFSAAAAAHTALPDGGIDESDERIEADAGVALEVPSTLDLPDAGPPAPTTTVTATRPIHSASEYSVPKDVVDAAPKPSATDLLRLVPGMVATQHSGAGKAQQLFLRGFDAVHGQDIELNVAGLPVNQPSNLHAIGYADVNWLIPEAVREIRVTEGTYRAFQGDFAVAGTVRFELGLAEPGIFAGVTAGRFGTYRLVAGFRPEADGTFVAGELATSEGFGESRAWGRGSVIGQVTVPLAGAKLTALAASYVTRFDSPGVVRLDDLERGRFGFFDSTARGQGGSTSRHQLLLGVDVPHDTGRSTVQLYGILSDLRLRNNFTGFFGDPRGDGLEQTHDVNTFGLRANHHRHFTVFGQPLNVDVGIGGRRDGIAQLQKAYRESDGTTFEDQVDARITQSSAYLYGEAIYSPGAWRFLLGARADLIAFEVVDNLAFTDPRFYDGTGYARTALGVHPALKAGIERHFGDHVRVFASYGDGFRSPQARSLAQGERAPFATVRSGELGVTFASSRFSAQLAGFGSWVQDDFFFDHTVGTTVFVGSTFRAGAALQLIARPIEGLVISASGTLATARLLERDALLPYFAPTVARVDVGYTKPFTCFGLRCSARAGAAATFIGPKPLPYGDESNTIGLVDVRLGARLQWFELLIDVTNVLDARWRDGEFVYPSRFDPDGAQSRLPSRQFTAGAPRQAFFTLMVHL